MRIQLVDPSAFTPPYDRALAAALARRGLDVELLTSRFLHGSVPEAEGYEVIEAFYRRTSTRGVDARARLPFKLAEHVPDMRRLRRRLDADVIHWQWMTLPEIDTFLLPPARPRVLTAHYVAGENAGRRELWAARRRFGAMDAVIAHSRHTADRLQEVARVPEERIRVIPHGTFDYMTRLPREAPLPEGLEGNPEGPVILFLACCAPTRVSKFCLTRSLRSRAPSFGSRASHGWTSPPSARRRSAPPARCASFRASSPTTRFRP